MNKLVKCSAAALLAASLFSMSGQSVNAATGYQRLTHNAYAYNYNGKRANNKLYRKGSKVKVIGSINLNGKKYNIISGNVYIKASNFNKRRSRGVLGNGYETQLLHNSYIYNAKGQRIKGTKLHKGHSVTCYGNPIRIHGKKYIQIGNDQFVRSSNVLLSYNGPTGSDSLNHTHRNTSNSIKQNDHNNSNSIANNGSNSSSQPNSANSTSNTTNSNSTTDKKDSDKSDINTKDSSKQNQSKSDSKNQPSDATKTTTGDSKNTNKDKSDTELATEADYVALKAALQKANNDKNANNSSWSKRNTFGEAYRKANSLLLTYQYDTPTASSSDIQKVITDLNTAENNLDGATIEAEMPKVTIEVSKDGTRKVIWGDKKQRQTVLNIVNKIFGASDARYVRMTNDMSITLTNQGMPNCEFPTTNFIKATYIYR